MPAKDVKALLSKHQQLTHSEMQLVVSHVQRQEGDWLVNTLMLQGLEVPFKFQRKRKYKNLKGARVNLTYYPETETIAGIDFEFMKVVRVKVA